MITKNKTPKVHSIFMVVLMFLFGGHIIASEIDTKPYYAIFNRGTHKYLSDNGSAFLLADRASITTHDEAFQLVPEKDGSFRIKSYSQSRFCYFSKKNDVISFTKDPQKTDRSFFKFLPENNGYKIEYIQGNFLQAIQNKDKNGVVALKDGSDINLIFDLFKVAIRGTTIERINDNDPKFIFAKEQMESEKQDYANGQVQELKTKQDQALSLLQESHLKELEILKSKISQLEAQEAKLTDEVEELRQMNAILSDPASDLSVFFLKKQLPELPNVPLFIENIQLFNSGKLVYKGHLLHINNVQNNVFDLTEIDDLAKYLVIGTKVNKPTNPSDKHVYANIILGENSQIMIHYHWCGYEKTVPYFKDKSIFKVMCESLYPNILAIGEKINGMDYWYSKRYLGELYVHF